MKIHEERRDGFLILGLEGQLDTNASTLFQEKIFAAIDGGESRLAVDLSRLAYVCSAGLRVFLAASKRLNPGVGKLVLYSLQEPVREVFDIVGFFSVLSIKNSKEEALESLR
jgi:stage II sporulation protein AA (anti-sigma F factor antagonist)